MSAIPKAALYFSPFSIWSAVARLALEEKGYGSDEVDLRLVDLAKGENYDPSFLRLNPNATVPTLVVPLAKTLSGDVDSRYKALTETKAIVDLLDKSRSAISRTQTTSHAPAPALAPATMAAANTSKIIIDDILHSEDADPNNLRYINARNDDGLRQLAKEVVPGLQGKQKALTHYLAEAGKDSIHVSEKVKKLWHGKLAAVEALLGVLENAGKSFDGLDQKAKDARLEFFATARASWETKLPQVLANLSKEMVGPFCLGDQFSTADLHLAAWLTRVVKLSGGSVNDDGKSATESIEKHIGSGFVLPRDFVPDAARRDSVQRDRQAKLQVFWDGLKERASWQKVYSEGLY